MKEQFQRTELLLGTEGMAALANARVAVFGVGGVGSYVTEALARIGIGTIDLVDSDTIAVSNLNRQIPALWNTIGQSKVEVLKERIKQINPEANIYTHHCYYGKENEDQFDFQVYDYVVDAIDSVTSKLLLAEKCQKVGTPLISSMGTGNKLHPELFEITDIYKTSVCPLAKVMRRECRMRGIKKLKVVYSKELPIKLELTQDLQKEAKEAERRSIPGSVSFVPGAAGLIIAGEVIRTLTGKK